MNRITVVDYGAGNLLNVVRALEHCGASVEITDKSGPIANAGKLVFPGVGAFADCMEALRARGIEAALADYIRSDRSFLGICVGMQVMFEMGEEFGEHKGLGILPGRVVRIPEKGTGGRPHKIPHIGWSALQNAAPEKTWEGTIFEGSESAFVYFVHSYMAVPFDTKDQFAQVDYSGVSICAAVKRGNAYGCQFHPEKSGEAGLAILRRFVAQ